MVGFCTFAQNSTPKMLSVTLTNAKKGKIKSNNSLCLHLALLLLLSRRIELFGNFKDKFQVRAFHKKVFLCAHVYFRKIPANVVGKPRRIMRRSPPQHVSRDERERLVNMATKLIVATVGIELCQIYIVYALEITELHDVLHLKF